MFGITLGLLALVVAVISVLWCAFMTRLVVLPHEAVLVHERRAEVGSVDRSGDSGDLRHARNLGHSTKSRGGVLVGGWGGSPAMSRQAKSHGHRGDHAGAISCRLTPVPSTA